MGEIPKDVLGLLTQLLPGFVVAWVVYGLTSYPKPAQFERVIQALIYSFLVRVLVEVEEIALLQIGKHIQLGVWDKQAELIAAGVTAIVLGFIFASLANSDGGYRLARKIGLTDRTAYPSEWFGAFRERINGTPRYVTLHLEGGRRISGYPREWPSDPTTGHFKLVDAAWILDDNSEVALVGASSILIPTKQVEFVEFLKFREENIDGTEVSKPAPA
jgi:Family of unknown function (DUF6338)